MLLKTYIKEMEWEGMDWINVADSLKGQVIGCCEHGNEPS
jgi:hypothetical protein